MTVHIERDLMAVCAYAVISWCANTNAALYGRQNQVLRLLSDHVISNMGEYRNSSNEMTSTKMVGVGVTVTS